MNILKKSDGFTIIELLIVIIALGILITLVFTTYSGVQAKNRNSDRQTNIDTLQSQLEAYYAQNSKYPTLASLNDASWRQANIKELKSDTLVDPSWNDKIPDCTVSGKSVTSGKPAKDCYSYQVTGSDGSACDNDKVVCAQYTLTALLEGGGKYVKSSLN